ncbi:tetratricopeptide repeat protein [Leptospira jelokensis]|uniref:Tetratricopeptide repeat protein n=1 Tax=Leptospira jelokensis TaxID=2484931 RepID=A0A4Z1A2W7_9LEPT|nr:tetratricopeptide repeat protein [Leptospira jelokensis]TGL67561.1 tetratricopeptide repeat protein [Leptospira jelokensis]
MNFNFFGFSKSRKQNLTLRLLVCFLLLPSFRLGAESTEIFLPFPETWAETHETDALETKSSKPSNPVSNQKNMGSDTKMDHSSNPPLVGNLNPTSSKEGYVAGNESTSTPVSVPNPSKSDSKKKKKKEVIDPSQASFQKGKAYLARDQKKSAEQEFASSYAKEGDAAKFSRVENTNLFGLDGKEKESSGLIEKQEDPDLKIKSQFELARSLDRIGNPESEEKAYKEYLKLVTEFPKHPELTPRSHYAMAVLLIRKKEYRSAAHQLVNIIKNFKESEEFLPAHHYLGKIYESSWDERDLERSLKYYQLYLNGVEGKNPKPGLDFRKETRDRLRVLGSAI